ncbi:hypothetical protein CEE37_03525 [candidate division LCP-89 bacterium B3_LCP]|uniref:Uncharacterized protein n=1 Tax=candidate division LCP-89 bacterium B3_LCP TaxID=2012998 RepID=A0A532V356_UNCL8|nr:MAG: hypothetical protein CEE37_03525 [candidate division LCP-89 bacterium B3_LCP]
MKLKIYPTAILMMAMLILTACDTTPDGSLSTGPVYTGSDSFNDLTVMNDMFYLTNFDLNEGSGNRIYLYSFDENGNPGSLYDLQMNGQGYISISSGDGDLFLFCQTTGLLLRVTPFGEYLATNWPGSAFIGWQAGGILSLPGDEYCVLLWKDDGHIKICSLDPVTLELEDDNSIQVPDRFAFRSVCANVQFDSLYVLCSDQNGADYVEIFDQGWVLLDEITLTDSLVAGISYYNGDIWVSTEDRRIVELSQVQ